MSALPRLVNADVAIVGGGIVGASAALALRRMGLTVALLERDRCGSRSSGVNYGGVRRQGRSAAQMPLAQRAHGIWGRLNELIGIDGEFIRSGHLKIARSIEDMHALEDYHDRMRDFELGLELLSGDRLRRMNPCLGAKVVGGSLCAEDGHANPRLVSPAFARAAQHAGAQIFEHTPVQTVGFDAGLFWLRCGGGLEVRTSRLINSAGAWAGAIAEQFGEFVPMQPEHPAMAVTNAIPRLVDWSLGVEGGSLYLRQVARGNIVFGGGRGRAIDEEHVRSTRSAMVKLAAQAIEILPTLRNAQIIRTWSGTEGFTPDRQPVIGPSQTAPGLVHGFGFSGAGFQIGPAVGEVLAELVRDGTSRTPIDAFSIKRFTHNSFESANAA